MKYTPLTLASLLVAALFSTSSFSAQKATLDDGTTVILNPDFTWHYPQAPHGDASHGAIAPEKNTTAPPVPLKTLPSPRYIDINLKQDKPIYQLSHAGVDLVLGKADYRDGKLWVPTAISNQSQDPVIKMSINIEIQDSQGQPLIKQTRAVWQAIKRLPDTYLRTQSSKPGIELSFDVPPLPNYRLLVTVDQLETR
ncbi:MULTISPECIES: DUF3157 family protein [unclassified Vibrio]|uniref:DUF3157 family protein n=1 Tax=Vibrio sp. HB236076 TaxID=3232307 RepID=A0AB39HDA1_9VIBR|nr:DUF3157 family protein [Vibrio sp. HB161653]MDP5255650.1 DUF3157 family protein [Vibrio sp. HB161653]